MAEKKLRICILGKFFPTQGGMAASAYWQAEMLSVCNIDVTVISNGTLVENEYRIKDGFSKTFPFDIHYIEELKNYYIPYRNQDIAALIDLFLGLNKQIDIIDAQYLLPFGIVAYFIHLITGVPYIIRHGGSDIEKFLNQGVFSSLFAKVLANAACVITDDVSVAKLATNVKYFVPYIPDHKKFVVSSRKKQNKINIAYIGKVNVLWRHKSLDKILNIFKNVQEMVSLTFLSQGKGIKNFKEDNATNWVLFKDFIPPWDMPAFYSHLDYVVFFCRDNPLPDWPCVLLEAISSGVKILTDSPGFFARFHLLIKNINDFIVPIPQDVTREELLKLLVENRNPVSPVYDLTYDTYVSDYISLYKSLLITKDL